MSNRTQEVFALDPVPDAIVFHRGVTAAAKSNGGGTRVPSRMPFTLDVLITGTASVKLYASNISDDVAGAHWGGAIGTFTASEKIVLENEPWIYWMVDVESVSGSVTVVAGA